MALNVTEEAELFGRLIELEGEQRWAALRAAGLDAEAERQMRRLLELDVEAEALLEREVLEEWQRWGRAGELEAGQQVGRYQTVRPLGRGGMGEVWLVEFEEAGVKRRGALKVLRGVVAGLERERRLLARLSHPYIAGMIESGVLEGGAPYLLIEYVEGQRMDEALVERTVRERVEVLRKVCEAVGAAHRQMVVHRDLKPGNVLITPDGLPKLVDFGIGQALDGGEAVVRAGTAAYASPEQLAGEEPTMASDVYSLGRMVERLVGDGGAELAAIGRKATAAESGERYGTVGEMEAELGRWLGGRPVWAYGRGWGYRVRCLVRRQPWATAGVTVAVGVMVVALVVAWGQYRQAQDRARELRTLAGVVIFDVDELVRKLPGSFPARQKLLETATSYLANLEAAAKLDRGARTELAEAYHRTAQLMAAELGQSLGREEDGFVLIEKSYRLREELGQFAARDLPTRLGYAESARDYGQKLRLRRRVEESDKVMERAEAHLAQWLREEPRSWQALRQESLLGNMRTRRLRLQGLQLALDNQRRVVGRLGELRAAGAPERDYWRLAAAQYSLLGGVLVDDSLREYAPELLVTMTEAVKAAEALYRLEPGVFGTRQLLTISQEYVEYTTEMGVVQWGEVDRLLRRIEALLSASDLPDREAPYWERSRVELLKIRGWVAAARGDLEEMRRWFRECRAALDRVEPQKQMWVAMLRAQLGIKAREMEEGKR